MCLGNQSLTEPFTQLIYQSTLFISFPFRFYGSESQTAAIHATNPSVSHIPFHTYSVSHSISHISKQSMNQIPFFLRHFHKYKHQNEPLIQPTSPSVSHIRYISFPFISTGNDSLSSLSVIPSLLHSVIFIPFLLHTIR